MIDVVAITRIGFGELTSAYPLLWVGRFLLRLPIRVARAGGAYWGLRLALFIVTVIKARPIIPFNRKKQPLKSVRHLVWCYLSYAARSIIERFFAVAKSYYRLDTSYVEGWDAVLIHSTLASTQHPGLYTAPWPFIVADDRTPGHKPGSWGFSGPAACSDYQSAILAWLGCEVCHLLEFGSRSAATRT